MGKKTGNYSEGKGKGGEILHAKQSRRGKNPYRSFVRSPPIQRVGCGSCNAAFLAQRVRLGNLFLENKEGRNLHKSQTWYFPVKEEPPSPAVTLSSLRRLRDQKALPAENIVYLHPQTVAEVPPCHSGWSNRQVKPETPASTH